MYTLGSKTENAYSAIKSTTRSGIYKKTTMQNSCCCPFKNVHNILAYSKNELWTFLKGQQHEFKLEHYGFFRCVRFRSLSLTYTYLYDLCHSYNIMFNITFNNKYSLTRL